MCPLLQWRSRAAALCSFRCNAESRLFREGGSISCVEWNVSITGENVMTLESLIVLLIVGAIAGWLAGQIVRGYGFGLVGNIVVGIIGAVIAGWLFPRLGVPLGGGWIGSIISAVIGAVILLFIIGLIKR
jgi:uncharacterized membrane protein YeaQ/YmgE (transglycosylase-associated protein family)